MSRKIFNYENLNQSKTVSSLKSKNQLYSQTISACGCLFYKKTTKELLLISYTDPNWPNYDDFGGTIDEDDNTVYETICRETAEETNGVISEIFLRKIIKLKKYNQFYNSLCKYFFITVCVDDTFYPNTDVFGNFEEEDKISRTIKWVPYQEAIKKLAVRLSKSNELMQFLNNEFKLKNKLKTGFSEVYF